MVRERVNATTKPNPPAMVIGEDGRQRHADIAAEAEQRYRQFLREYHSKCFPKIVPAWSFFEECLREHLKICDYLDDTGALNDLGFRNIRFTGQVIRDHRDFDLDTMVRLLVKASPSDVRAVSIGGRLLHQLEDSNFFYHDAVTLLLASDDWARVEEGGPIPLLRLVFHRSDPDPKTGIAEIAATLEEVD
jgi:hypothetical protein